MQGLLPHTRNASATVQISRRKNSGSCFTSQKSPNGTWKDYYFEIRAYFEGWLNELNIDSFDGIEEFDDDRSNEKEMLSECKEPLPGYMEELISEMLADKLKLLTTSDVPTQWT
ncbi:hypothetical protein TNCV_3879481 [Trichonephila clavipes]|nr:hypothetical protein TNCV_3879481 [Trichonephila clavipes]